MLDEPFQISCYSRTDVGRLRKLNEDRSHNDAGNGVFVVADGMGGHEAGDFASEAIVSELRTMPAVTSAVQLNDEFHSRMFSANGKIRRHAATLGNDVIGSTVVGLLVFGQAYRCIWAGDSRAYLLRGDMLVQLTRDHTEMQDLISRGLLTPTEAENYPRKNVITNAIGVSDYIDLARTDGIIENYDMFLLCSDGLTGHVSNEEIGDIMAGRRTRDICEMLVELALERGGTDNITVSAVQFIAAKATIPVIGHGPVDSPA